ncbi:MAG: hypothetical protein JETT_2866 [Candidatus Jettenia ecosi]|uniref:Uncharacterized protein n=1 Tax=Candidatus Jettenia ecosi TaxID=2494326 RepID=A0A533Q8B4_9BACT|nr:MAG: hypothetical protein JETT_2866 [Candidatus Jettenia ecosi]
MKPNRTLLNEVGFYKAKLNGCSFLPIPKSPLREGIFLFPSWEGLGVD